MVLRDRLKMIYDLIPQCNILSDIGTDHALIPAYSILNNKCMKAIACDVRKGPLQRAEKTMRKYFLEDRMELRLGSGLVPIEENEVDGVVIAGMGGILITELISESMRKAQKASFLILQPMVGQELVRPFLWRNGFEVCDEVLTLEGDKLYQSILVRYTGDVRTNWSKIDEVIGEKLVQKKDTLIKSWIENRINKQKKIGNGLKTSKNNEEGLYNEETLLVSLESLLKYHQV